MRLSSMSFGSGWLRIQVGDRSCRSAFSHGPGEFSGSADRTSYSAAAVEPGPVDVVHR